MRQTLNVLLEDRPGALDRALGLLRGRGVTVHSLHVRASGEPGISLMTLVIATDDVERVARQLDRLVNVLEVEIVTSTGDITDGQNLLQR